MSLRAPGSRSPRHSASHNEFAGFAIVTLLHHNLICNTCRRCSYQHHQPLSNMLLASSEGKASVWLRYSKPVLCMLHIVIQTMHTVQESNAHMRYCIMDYMAS